MLKIKDNIDLKELEKYGFENFDQEYNGKTTNYWSLNNREITINYWERRRKREIALGAIVSRKSLDTLYDLIKDNLIEKEN